MSGSTRNECVRKSRRGASLVELILALPVFLAVVFGVVEFGRAMIVGQLVTNAARLGAEQAAQEGAAPEAVDASVRKYIVNAMGISAQRVCVLIGEPSEQSPGPGSLPSANRNSTAKCAVTVAVNYDDVSYLAGRFLAGTQLTYTCSVPQP